MLNLEACYASPTPPLPPKKKKGSLIHTPFRPFPRHRPTTTQTQDTLKAVILRGTPTTSTTALSAAADYSAQRETAADNLAADIVRSLSEVFADAALREDDAAAAAAAEWSSIWEKVAGVSLEARRETAATTASVETPVVEEWASDKRRLRGEREVSQGEDYSPKGTAVGEAKFFFSPEGNGRGLLEEDDVGVISLAECEEVGAGAEDFLQIESTWLNLVMTVVCVTCAGLAAGLTMGLLSIEPLEMAIKQRSGESRGR